MFTVRTLGVKLHDTCVVTREGEEHCVDRRYSIGFVNPNFVCWVPNGMDYELLSFVLFDEFR